MNKNEKLMLNTLRWLSRFNLGDKYEERIVKTLVKVGHCPHLFSVRYPRCACIYCNKTRKELKE